MTVEQKFDQVIAPAHPEHETQMPTQNGYYAKVWKVIEQVRELSLSPYGDPVSPEVLLMIFNELKDTIDFLTRPRSINDFLSLKWYIYQEIKEGNLEGHWKLEWIHYLLPTLGLVSIAEMNILKKAPVDFARQIFLGSADRRSSAYGAKRVTVTEAQDRLRSIHEARIGPNWVGYVTGKWRREIHEGHSSLFEMARQVLGIGVLLAGMESKRSIEIRLESGVYVLDDEARLKLLEAQQDVDFVICIDPPPDRLGDPVFFNEVVRALQPNYWFIGSHNHELFDVYAAEAEQRGVQLLWGKEEQDTSTTGRIQDVGKSGLQ